jgi:cold shock CspA family protein
MIGKIIEWRADRAYGWISFNNGRQIFSHISDWSNLDDVPTIGQTVEFEIAESKNDSKRRKAVNVRVVVSDTLAGVQ